MDGYLFAGQQSLVGRKFSGPMYSDRRVHDVIGLLLFFGTLAAVGVVSSIAFSKGDPRLVLYPMDSAGNLCGVNNLEDWRVSQVAPGLARDFASSKYLYFLSVKDIKLSTCVAACPGNGTDASASPSCPSPSISFLPGPSYDPERALKDPACQCMESPSTNGTVCFQKYASAPVARRCLPTLASLRSPEVLAAVNSVNGALSRSVGEDRAGWKIVAYVALIALGLSFVWMMLLHFFAGAMVWFTIGAALALAFLVSTWLTLKSRDMYAHAADVNGFKDQQEMSAAKNYSIAGKVGFAVSAVLLLIVVFMFKRIQVAVGVVKFASKALARVPFVFGVPLGTFGVAIGAVVFYAALGIYLLSTGKVSVSASGCCRQFELDAATHRLIYFVVFSCVWTVLVVLAVGYTTVNGAVAQVYFTGEGNKAHQSSFPVAKAFSWVMLRHLGSLCLGSLLIAIVVVVRMVVAQLSERMKKIRDTSAVRFLVCCTNCCLACFQRFLEFITTHAYVQIAITGHSFCHAARDAFALVASNPLRFAAVELVTGFVTFLGKVAITAGSVLIASDMLKRAHIGSWLFLWISGLVAYVVALFFFSVFEAAVRTILHCFIIDEQQNGSNSFAPEELRGIIAGAEQQKA
jgi:hypothetical protein